SHVGYGGSNSTPYKPLLGFLIFQCGTLLPSHSHTPPHVWRIFKPNTWTALYLLHLFPHYSLRMISMYLVISNYR
ncbi:unnamed protein product, partial [Prunus brigantina]